MAEIISETVRTRSTNLNPVTSAVPVREATYTQTTEYLIYFFFGFLEILLAFRLVLKLAGASQLSGFVRFIYGLTGVAIMPFEGMFRRGFAPGLETASVLEPSTLVALIVYPVLVWGIIKLMRIFSGERQVEAVV